MVRFVPVATLDQLREGHGREVEVEGRIIALFRVGDEITAMDGLCPHQGGPLADGSVEGPLIYCPWHRWGFDRRTGQSLVNPTWQQTVYPVEVRGQEVWVAIDGSTNL